MFVTVEDILIRHQRMLGRKRYGCRELTTPELKPNMYLKKLAKEDKSRFDFDRESLYKMIWEYVQDNSNVAINQIKRLGASADWSRKIYSGSGSCKFCIRHFY